MAKKRVAKKSSKVDRMTLLTDMVKTGLLKATEKLPTPGQIVAYLKVEHKRRIEYSTAKAIQARLKRYVKKTTQTVAEITTPAPHPAPVVEEVKSAGQLRYSGNHG